MNIVLLFFTLFSLSQLNDNSEPLQQLILTLNNNSNVISEDLSESQEQVQEYYWGRNASEYGFQPYNGFGNYYDYLKFKEETGYGHDVYDPSHEFSNSETNVDSYSEYQGYYTDPSGALIENPIYEHRYGPEENE